MAALPGMFQTATVWKPNDDDGAYTVADIDGLACILTISGIGAIRAARDRSEMTGQRLLLWDADYVLPSENVQFEIETERWNIVAGSVFAARGPDGTIVYRRAETNRATEG